MSLPVLVAQWQAGFLCAVTRPPFLQAKINPGGRPNGIEKARLKGTNLYVDGVIFLQPLLRAIRFHSKMRLPTPEQSCVQTGFESTVLFAKHSATMPVDNCCCSSRLQTILQDGECFSTCRIESLLVLVFAGQ